jgi:hypothetical protein
LPRKRSRNKVRAIFECDYPGGLSRTIAGALQVDNKSTDETTIKTICEDGRVVTTVESVSIEKLLPVLDDILSCQSLCERTLDITDGESS